MSKQHTDYHGLATRQDRRLGGARLWRVDSVEKGEKVGSLVSLVKLKSRYGLRTFTRMPLPVGWPSGHHGVLKDTLQFG